MTAALIEAGCVFLFGAVACARGRRCGVGAVYSLPVVLFFGALATASAAVASPGWPQLLGLACAAVCAVTDLHLGYIFDDVLVVASAAVAGAALLDDGWRAAALGLATAAAPPLALHAASRGRAMGCGDVKLAACLGLAFGARASVACLGYACVLGGLVAAGMLIARRAAVGSRLPFAPFLAAGACLVAMVPA